MRLGQATLLTLCGVLAGCEVPEGILEDLPDGSHGHELDAGMDSGHQHLEDAAAEHHDAEIDASEHVGFGLHHRPSNITCVAPEYLTSAATSAAQDGGVVELMPEKLSETGCFETSDPSQPLAGLIPFDLNAALWSDGASKRRWMALPEGTHIKVVAEGDFEFPPGTMLIKEFSLGGRRLETRFFVHHPEQLATDAGIVESGRWAGYTYQWNAEQTDATLVAFGPTTEFAVDRDAPDLGTWKVPSREECMRCHSLASGRSLGPEIAQLNRDFTYEATKTTSNQLATLDHIGLFAQPLASPDTYGKLADPKDEAEDLDERARAYLHANCSFCHRKAPLIGEGGGPDEFRASVAFDKMGICDVLPSIPAAAVDLGMDTSMAKILAPMSRENSVLWKRMEARGDTPAGARRMPPIGSRVADQEGLNLIAQWINSITACPAPGSTP